VFPHQGFSAEERRLIKLYRSLAVADRQTLLAFGAFLVQRAEAAPDQPGSRDPAPLDPRSLERPAGESVVAAIKRLRRAYHMLERGDLLHESASLMSAHVLHGRPADEVIGELEALFGRRYAAYLDARASSIRG
jgi:hypothetical protein